MKQLDELNDPDEPEVAPANPIPASSGAP